jgi:hypothetical protein
MMRAVKTLLVVLLALAVLLAIAGFFLPTQWRVERSIAIRASPDAIFPLISNLKAWEGWSPWNRDMDPTLQISYEGPASGVGAISRWTGEKIGRGRLEVTASDPARGIVYDLSMEGGAFRAQGSIMLEAQTGGTKVTWAGSGQVGMNPIGRYFVLLLDPMIGSDLMQGLDTLKERIEKGR